MKSIREAMERRRAPFYLRRTKEAMVYFPQRMPDGTWEAKKIFTKRIPHTVDFHIDGAEDELYREVTAFVKAQSHRAAANGDDPRARAIRFLMALYQRRLASSTYALRRSLENRAKRLGEMLKKAQEIARYAPPDLPDMDELDEMEDSERERLEDMIAAVSLARNPEQVKEEIGELNELVEARHPCRGCRTARRSCPSSTTSCKQQGFFDNPQQRLLIFTEFKDTLDYLVKKLREWGFTVGTIHGGMNIGSRDDAGTRLHAEQQFREGATQVLVATEAAGEGINLQCCNILFNYDIPWNPNRLEQRMGRIHRYGQTKDCLIFNFVATNTIEGHVLQRLLEKLQEIRDALDDDSVFNVVGEILPPNEIERILRDYYAGKIGNADLEERLLRDVKEEHFRAICQNALEGLATKKLNLEMLIERRARAQERRVVPETIARFIKDAAPLVPLTLKTFATLPYTFEPTATPPALRQYDKQPDWKCQPVAAEISRASRPTARSRTGTTWNGSRRGTRCSRPCVGTPWLGHRMHSPRARAFTRSKPTVPCGWTSTAPGLLMASGTSSTSGCSRPRLPSDGTITALRSTRFWAICSQPPMPMPARACRRCRSPPRGFRRTPCCRSWKMSARSARPRSSASPPTSRCLSPN